MKQSFLSDVLTRSTQTLSIGFAYTFPNNCLDRNKINPEHLTAKI